MLKTKPFFAEILENVDVPKHTKQCSMYQEINTSAWYEIWLQHFTQKLNEENVPYNFQFLPSDFVFKT